MARVVLKNVKKNYAGIAKPAVEECTLEIKDKEFLVLVGPSGCGKSTTLRMIAGLEEITDGEIYIGDRLVNDVPPKDRDIAMVFQNYALYPHMTVYKNMAFGLMLRKFPKAEIDRRVREAAEILGITQYLGPQAQGPLRRRAPTRGGGPRHRAQASGLPVRRAPFQPRRQDARPDAHRDQQAPPPATGHDDLRDARPGRSHDHGRPDRGHAPGPYPADRRADLALRQAGQ